ncbi:MAG: hypothetical protein RIR00_2561, partial [Pseudomonadota bacterium]
NNAYVVIVGDVDHAEVFRLAEQHYGPLAGRELAKRKPQEEPAQKGIRRLTVKAPAELPTLSLGYKTPVLRDIEKDSEPYALEMLAAILDGHDAARLNTRLVREQRLAVEIGVGYDSTARGPSLFYLQASPAPGHSVAELETALRAELTRLQQDGVSAEELQRAKTQLIAGETFKLDSMFAQAMEIGQMESSGIPYPQEKRILEKLQQVSAAEVQAVARKYFTDDSLTVGVLDPQPLPDQPRPRGPKGRH